MFDNIRYSCIHSSDSAHKSNTYREGLGKPCLLLCLLGYFKPINARQILMTSDTSNILLEVKLNLHFVIS